MHSAEAILKPTVTHSVCEKCYFPFRMWLICFSKQGGVNFAWCNLVINVDHSILPVACERKMSWGMCVLGSF